MVTATRVPRAELFSHNTSIYQATAPFVEICLALLAAAYSIRCVLQPTSLAADSFSMLFALASLGLGMHGLYGCCYGPARNLYVELTIGEFRFRRWRTLAQAEVLAVLVVNKLEPDSRHYQEIMDVAGGIWLNGTYLQVSFALPEEGRRHTGYLQCGKILFSLARPGMQLPIQYRTSRLSPGRHQVRFLRE